MKFPRGPIAFAIITFANVAAIAGTPYTASSLRGPLLHTQIHSQNPIRLSGGLVVACLWAESNSLVLSPLIPVSRSGILPLSLADCPTPIEEEITGGVSTTSQKNPILIGDSPGVVGSDSDLVPSPLDKLIAPPGLGGETSSSRVSDDELESRKVLTLLAPNLLYFDPRGRAELDRTIADFRARKDRTPSGLWKLRLVYHGASQIISEVAPPAEDVLAANREIVSLWIREHPASPAPYVFMATILRNHALATLRNPLEATKRARWNDGSAALAELRAYLMQHKEVASSDPHWYALMIEVMGFKVKGVMPFCSCSMRP